MKRQAPNTTPATRLKAERLTILNINANEAIVEGDTSDYVVVFRSLTCSCPAGLARLHCSHCQAAIRERARMRGFEHTAFSPNAQHMEAYAGMQRKAGKRTEEHSDNGYFYVCSGKPVAPAIVRPRHDAIQARAEELFG